MIFGEAFELTKKGKSIRLPHWNPETRISAQYSDAFSKMTTTYLYVTSLKGRVPWIPTFPEMFSEDWEIFEP